MKRRALEASHRATRSRPAAASVSRRPSDGPTSRFVVANRLRHHLLEWGDGPATVLLLHGFLEHAHVWDAVAPRLAAAGHRVCALDWRGHGDSQWVGAGGYYHFADYVADLAALVRGLGGRVALIAHSMGGNAALLLAGSEPARVTALASIEGLGPLGADASSAPDRYAGWLDDLSRQTQRGRARFSLAEATKRLRVSYPRLADLTLRHLARHGTRGRGAARQWKFDPLHQTRSPQPFYVEQARAFWRRITCPVLYIEGEESIMRLPEADLAERLAILRAERATIVGSGHHPHLEQPDALAEVLIGFLRRALPVD